MTGNNAALEMAGGVAAVAGGILWSAKVLADEFAAGSTGFTDDLLFVVPLLFAAGTAGIWSRYSGRMESRANAGFVQTFAGLALLAAGLFLDLTLGVEDTARISSFGFIILALGLVLLGFSTLRTDPLPRWNFLPLALGLIIPANIVFGNLEAAGVTLSALFGLGWAALGYTLLSDRGEAGDERVK